MDYKILEKSPNLLKLRIFHPEFSRAALITTVSFLILGIFTTIISSLGAPPNIGAMFGSVVAYFFGFAILFYGFLPSSYDSMILINQQEGIVQRDIYYRILRKNARRTLQFSSISRVYFATDARSKSCALKIESTSRPHRTRLFFAVPLPEFKQWPSYFRELLPGIPFTSEEFQAGYELRAL